MMKEIINLNELNEFGGLALTRTRINEIIELAKPKNEFYVGTDMAQWLNSFEILDESDMIERFSLLDDEEEIISGTHLHHEFEEINWDNSYNWSGHSNCEIDFKIIQSEETQEMFAYIRVHLGGDVRGNYSEGLLIDLDSYLPQDGSFMFENVYECGNSGFIEIDGIEYSVDGNITNEYLSIYNHTTDESYEICGAIYEYDEESFNKALIEIINEAVENDN